MMHAIAGRECLCGAAAAPLPARRGPHEHAPLATGMDIMPCPASFCIVILPFARRSLRDRASVVPGARWPGGAGGTAWEGKRGGRMAGPNAQKLLATDG